MKKLIVTLLILAAPTFAHAVADPCTGDAQTIPLLNNVQGSNPSTPIQPFINNYANYYRSTTNRYELCFTYPNSNLPFTNLSAPLTLPSSADKPVVISGLVLKCSVKATGVGFKLTTADGNQWLTNNEIKNCAVGVQIGDAQNVGNNIQVGPANKIHDNLVGIKVVNGLGNWIGQNLVYLNSTSSDNVYSQNEGIEVVSGMNGGIQPPAPFKEGQAAQTDDPILHYPTAINSNDTVLPTAGQTPIIAKFKVPTPYSTGALEANLIDTYNFYPNGIALDGVFQGNKISADPNQNLTQLNCSNSESAYAWCDVPMTANLKDAKVLFIFHDPNYGSTTYSLRYELNGPGILSASDLDAPNATLPPSVSNAASDDDNDSGSGLGGVSAYGGGGGGGGPSGVQVTGATGGLQAGCGSSLNPHDTFSMQALLLFMLMSGLPIGGLILVRRKRLDFFRF